MEAIYDVIGAAYNSTRKADPFIANQLFNLLKPEAGKLYLDIGCGIGNYTCALAEMGVDFIGVEPSDKMLREAFGRDQKITWLNGTAEQIPLSDSKVDGVIATLTIHHWTNLEQSMREIYRITKPHSLLVIFTATPEQMCGYWLNHYFPEMLGSSMEKMLSLNAIDEAVTMVGFKIETTEKYFIQDTLHDNFLYAGKNRPELYLNERIRKGISSFSALANKDEVSSGLLKLSTDLQNGDFEVVKNRHENNDGDYLFIVAKRQN